MSVKNLNDRLNTENNLIDSLLEFTLKYKLDISTVDRKSEFIKTFNQLHDILLRNQKEYVEYINLKETIDSKIEDLTKQKLEFKNQLKNIRDEIEDLLDLPFTGKNDIEANQRVGADHAIHVVLEIFDKYLKNV